jgi:hypothetical protein
VAFQLVESFEGDLPHAFPRDVAIATDLFEGLGRPVTQAKVPADDGRLAWR